MCEAKVEAGPLLNGHDDVLMHSSKSTLECDLASQELGKSHVTPVLIVSLYIGTAQLSSQSQMNSDMRKLAVLYGYKNIGVYRCGTSFWKINI